MLSLGRPDDEVLGKLLPALSGARPLMLVQANVLDYGATAIGACFNHKIMDACASSAFLKDWAAVARGADESLPVQNLDIIGNRFPVVSATMPPVEPGEACKCSTRRFVFQAVKIAALRDKTSSAGAERPTRVVAVWALIWKCIANALTKKSGRETRPPMVSQAMNLRTRLHPPLSEDSLGNMIVPFLSESDDRNYELEMLAAKLSQGLTVRSYVTKLSDSETARTIIFEDFKKCMTLVTRKDINFYMLTSWCRFGWYELDFGWGKPAWISTVSLDIKNLVIMTDTRDGDGVEVLATLPKQDMIFFETDPELLEFGVLNPSVCP